MLQDLLRLLGFTYLGQSLSYYYESLSVVINIPNFLGDN